MHTMSLHHGDCLTVLRTLTDNSVDAVVTDPPYGLSFMAKKWDYDVPSEDIWRECLRVLKPGGHLLAFAGTRTQHRMAVRIEDAGFEIRDMIAWVYGSGFPKSLDVEKAIHAKQTTGRSDSQVTGDGRSRIEGQHFHEFRKGNAEKQVLENPIPEAAAWHGWGTALKPALEPITVARKPLDGTVAENVLRHGTGAINVDGCRVVTDELKGKVYNNNNTGWKCTCAPSTVHGNETGRWPANLIHDGSDEVVGLFPDSKGSGPARTLNRGQRDDGWGMADQPGNLRDAGSGSAARFFYTAKASKADRERGLDDAPTITATVMINREPDSAGMNNPRAGAGRTSGSKNPHPTVKPIALMRYLIRLVTPPNGVVLDPFMGSGTTGLAARDEQKSFIGIERDDAYFHIAQHRLNKNAAAHIPTLDV